MNIGAGKKLRKNGIRLLSLLLCITLMLQLFGIDITALGASTYAFQGYDNENITNNTFGYAYTGATVSGTTVTMTDDSGEAIGYIQLNDPSANISASVDLGGLEIDFSTMTYVDLEGVDGSENDVPTVTVSFCSDSNYLHVISSVALAKPDAAVSGNVPLSSNASIPSGTRSMFIHLYGENTNTESSNTVVFTNTSLVIHDAAPPTCTVDYNTSWTNGSITVTVSAADGDSGLEGIYINEAFVTAGSPHTFTVTENTDFRAYSKDYAGKTSDVQNITIDNIDTAVPDTPAAMTLSHDTWTNTDVTVTMPELGTGTGAPEKYVYRLGESAWQDFTPGLAVSDSGQYNISIAVEDEAGNMSGTVDDIIYIDKLAPSIDSVSQTVASGSCVVSVSTSDAGLSRINAIKYAAGSHDAAYFASGGTTITGGEFTVTAGGTYTIYVSDVAGNYDIGEYVINTAPTLIDIVDTTVAEDGTINIPVNVSDNETSLADLIVSATSSDESLISNIVVNQSESAISLDITPEPDRYGGPVTITLQVEDSESEVTSDTFTVTVLSENDAPTAADDLGIVTNEDESVTIDVLANDTDSADGDTLTISDPGEPAHGTASVVAGKIVYTPDENYNGEDSFVYTIGDGNGGSANATVCVSVTAADDAPVANNDTATTDEDVKATIDVLANDTDADLDDMDSTETLTISQAGNGSHGTTEIVGGKIEYTPDLNWSGTDSFTYTICDNALTESTATVTVTVTTVNDEPQYAGLNESYAIDEDSIDAEIAFSITDVETAADSLMLQAASLDENYLESGSITIEGLGDELDAVTLKVTPVPDMYGDVVIRLSLGDGFTTIIREITLTINGVNDVPAANTDTLYFDEDTVLTIEMDTLIENDTDIEGDTLTFDGIETTTSVGTLAAVDGDTYEYTPAADYDGTDSFTYYVWDGTDRAVGTCNLIARAGNDAPAITIPESNYTTDEDTAKAGIVFNISDQESDAADLIVTAGSSDTDLVSTDGISIVNNGDGTCTISVTPMDDANGTAVVTVTVSDGDAKTLDSFDFIINPVQDAPVAVDDYAYIPLSGRLSFDVLLNDRDVDGDSLSVLSYDGSSLPGSLTYNAEAHGFTYIALVGETGTSTFTYTVSDGAETTADDTATVTLDVHAVTHAPVLSAIGNKYIMEDGNTGNIPFSVTDVDYGDEITITVSSGNTTLLPEDFVNNIIVTDNGDGTYTLYLEPAADAYGTAAVTVTATDLFDNTDTETLTLKVYAQNDPPVAVDDAVTTNEDTSVVLDMLSNDSDPEGDTIWVSSIEWPANGTLTRSGSAYTYVPYGNFNGTEELTYEITDGSSTVSATITITVAAVNDAPVARDNWAEVPNIIAGSRVINVLGNDYDPDGDTVRLYQIVEAPQHGTAIINLDGTILYTRLLPSGESNGADSFVYRIIDRDTATGDYLSDTATVYIGVDFVSSLTCYTQSAYCYEDGDAFIIDLSGSITNPNSVSYDLTIDETTSLGTFEVLSDTQVRFTPAANANGYQTITYSASETGGGESDSSYIYLHVYPVNDTPAIDSAPDTVSCDEDDSAQFTVTFSDVDCDPDDLYFYAYAANTSSGGPIPLSVGISNSRSGGSATVTVTPGADAFGTLDVVVCLSDGLVWVTHTVNMTVNPVDDAPALYDVYESLYEDTDITISVVTPDSDVDGDNLTVFIADGDEPAHGTAVVNAGGTITYTPDDDYYGSDNFVFSVKDDTAGELTSTATANFTVMAINDPPVITNLGYYYSTNEDTTKEVTLTVTDVDNDLSGPASYTITSSDESIVANENITISQVSGYDMKITLAPETNAYGKTIISVTATDGVLSVQREFQLTVLSVNDVPVAMNDEVTVSEEVAAPAGETGITINVLANDSDIEDTSLQVVEVKNLSIGSVVNNQNGFLTYSVDGDFNGTATFNYTVMDDNGATATAMVTVNVTPMNDPPCAANDAVTIIEDAAPVTISVLSNDSDTEDDTLSLESVSTPSHGTAAIDGTNIIYDSNADYYGSDSFTYEISDGNGGTATATVTVTIRPQNDAPTIEKHSSNSGDWVMDEDSTAPFNFVVADVETATSNLIVEITSQNTSLIRTTSIVLSSGDGYKIITVTPEANVHGTVPIEISVTDGAATTTEVFDIIITSVNDAPVISAPENTTPEDTPVSGSVSAADIDTDTGSLTFTKASNPAHGSVTVNADGTYTYTPSEDWNGTDSFDVTVDDGEAASNQDTGTVVITVTPVNDAPDAADDTAATAEDTAVTIDVLDNDSDIDQDSNYNAEPDTTALTISISESALLDPVHGGIAVVEGQIVYTPDLNYNGSDTFGYNAYDGQTQSTATVTVTITAVNDAPAANDLSRTINEDTECTIAWAGIASDVDGDNLTITIEDGDGASNGTAIVDGTNIKYTPAANWYGVDSFTYTATDGEYTDTGVITVTVLSVNDAPAFVTMPDTMSLTEDGDDGSGTFSVTDIETPAGDLVVTVYSSTNSTLVGTGDVTLTSNGDGTWSVTVDPNDNRNGSATIKLRVTDGNGGHTDSTFVVTVAAVNDAPANGDDTATTDEDTYVDIDVLDNDDVDSDIEGDTLSITAFDATSTYGGTVATVTVNDRTGLRYTPAENWYGTDTFTYTVMDKGELTAAFTVTVTVNSVNDAPDISPAEPSDVTTDEDTQSGTVTFTVTDVEDDDSTLAMTLSVPAGDVLVGSFSEIGVSDSTRTFTITPSENENGTVVVTVTVEDSNGGTAEATFNFIVTAVNDGPIGVDDSATVDEDDNVTIDVLDNDDVDTDHEGDTLTIAVFDATTTNGGSVEIVTVDEKQQLKYTPAADWYGTDTFTYTVEDGQTLQATATVTVTVNPVNDAPVVTLTGASEYTVNEGAAATSIGFTVTDVDNDTNCGTSEVTLGAESDNPILLFNGLVMYEDTGIYRYINVTPYNKWNGAAVVTITAADPDGATDTTSFTFNVNSVNETPVAADDTFTIPEDALTEVDVLNNDTDGDLETNPDTEKLYVSSVTDNDDNAVITISDDGCGVNIQPITNYNGPVTFTYVTEDALGATSNTATVTVTVSQVNDAPEATDDTGVTTEEDTAVTIDVLANDSDIDQTEGLNADPDAEVLSIQIGESGLTAPPHGSLAVVDGQIEYTPDADYNGPDSFTYYVYDGDTTDMGTVSVTITQVNDNPVAVEDSANVDEDGSVDIYPLTNDTDVDTVEADNKNDLHYTSEFTITSAGIVGDAHGSITYDTGKITYTPFANSFTGNTISYTMSDGNEGSATGTITVTVNSINDLPVFDTTPANMSLTEDEEDGQESFTVSDIETAGAGLTVTATDIDSVNTLLLDLADVTITAGEGGSRTVTVNPNDNQNGSATVTLRVTDGNSGYTECTFDVTVAAVNDAPAAQDVTTGINEDVVYSVAWATITSDVDIATNGDSLSVEITTGAGHGTAAVSGANITYTPDTNWNGTDSFVYTVTDSSGLTDTGTITITVNSVNDAPVAQADSGTIAEDTSYTADWTELTSDVDIATNGDSLSVGITGAAGHGTAVVDGANITYTPNKDYNGTDSFTYTVTDSGGLTDTATITVAVTQVNDAPVAVNDEADTPEDTEVTVDVLDNDFDVDTYAGLNGNDLHNVSEFSIASVGEPAHGSVEIVDNELVYTPETNYNGDDTITYEMSDGHGGSAGATLTVHVGAINDSPVANDDVMNTDEDTEASVDVLANDTDIDEDTLTFVEFTQNVSGYGTIGESGGVVTFMPKADYHGSFTVGYRVSDGNATATATITIIVNPINDAPEAQYASKTTLEDTPLGIGMAALVSDVDDTDDSNLTITVESGDGPVHGTVDINGLTITYTPGDALVRPRALCICCSIRLFHRHDDVDGNVFIDRGLSRIPVSAGQFPVKRVDPEPEICDTGQCFRNWEVVLCGRNPGLNDMPCRAVVVFQRISQRIAVDVKSAPCDVYRRLTAVHLAAGRRMHHRRVRRIVDAQHRNGNRPCGRTAMPVGNRIRERIGARKRIVRRIGDLAAADGRRAVRRIRNPCDGKIIKAVFYVAVIRFNRIDIRVVCEHIDRHKFFVVRRRGIVIRHRIVVDLSNRYADGCLLKRRTVRYRVCETVAAVPVRIRRIYDLPLNDR
ncbi:MAG: Ig-like domain-containing protein, partial [Eubacteriales bacterium]|nr:Ig-like domain-containing protein [Eubacteriales bacterium]